MLLLRKCELFMLSIYDENSSSLLSSLDLILQHKPYNWGKRLSPVTTINVTITIIVFKIILGIGLDT